ACRREPATTRMLPFGFENCSGDGRWHCAGLLSSRMQHRDMWSVAEARGLMDIRENITVDPYNVVFVDRVKDNFLFRGPNPVVQNSQPGPPYSFDYGGLTNAIAIAAQRAGQSLPAPYRLIEINLLQWGNANEIPMILAEYNFFQYAQELGEFHFWETNGTGLCAVAPPLSDPAVQDYLARNLPIW